MEQQRKGSIPRSSPGKGPGQAGRTGHRFGRRLVRRQGWQRVAAFPGQGSSRSRRFQRPVLRLGKPAPLSNGQCRTTESPEPQASVGAGP